MSGRLRMTSCPRLHERGSFFQFEYTQDLLEMDDEYHVDLRGSDTIEIDVAVTLKEVREGRVIRSLDASTPCMVMNADWVKVPAIETMASTYRRLQTKGWTKAGIDKVHKIDSFLWESQRFNGPGVCPFRITFPNPKEFDGLCFAKLRQRDGNTVVKLRQLLRLQNTLLSDMGDTLGSPSQFFAINEVKALPAHILVTYDVKFEGKMAPRSFIIKLVSVPGKANAMLRKRQL
ncbi:hypothetical protein H4582DRAFT_2073661 [Lactarius indigo]|nr:hypothetical protein H4582DRAFT_2073661 [Lactarius indigo]